MTRELWVVYFESANYAGYGEHCLVWAVNEYDARDAASSYAEEFYFDRDYLQWEEDNEGESDDEVVWASIMTAVPLAADECVDVRKYLNDDTQARFYPIVNER